MQCTPPHFQIRGTTLAMKYYFEVSTYISTVDSSIHDVHPAFERRLEIYKTPINTKIHRNKDRWTTLIIIGVRQHT